MSKSDQSSPDGFAALPINVDTWYERERVGVGDGESDDIVCVIWRIVITGVKVRVYSMFEGKSSTSAARSVTVRAIRPASASPFTSGAPTVQTLAKRSFKLSPGGEGVEATGKAR